MTKYFLVNNASRAAAYGIGTYFRQVTSFLVEEQAKYEICSLDLYSDDKEFTIRKETDGIRRFCVPALQRQGNTLLYFKSILFWLGSYLQDDEPVIFHFNYSQHFDLIKLLKAKYTKSHIIYTIHYLNWCFSLNGNLSRFKKLIKGNTDDDKEDEIKKEFHNDKRLFSLCDDIVVLSKFTYKLLLEDYKIRKSKIHLVYNGMQYEVSNVKKNECVSSSKEILFVGRLDEAKGIGFIIKAFKKIVEKHQDVHLTFVGDGNFGQYLPMCEDVWDRVTFTGKLPHEKLEPFFHKATIGVLPSFNEQCSYTAIEMMAHGIPLIATDSTGLGEMMTLTPKNMLHIDEKDFDPDLFAEQLAQKMNLLLCNQVFREECSQKLLALFNEKYSIDIMKASMKSFFEKSVKHDGNISSDFIPYFDEECIRLINDRPEVDMDYIGLTGVGCYLWWRVENSILQKKNTANTISARLQEHLIYYIDWVCEIIRKEGKGVFPPSFEQEPFCWLLDKLLQNEFYKTKVQEIAYNVGKKGFNLKKKRNLAKNEIMRTALKIYNANF